jgi:exo-beta-1,3-glucanase (GH17 family)
MAQSQSEQPFLGQHGDASPVDGPDHDFPPPPPAHRVPVGVHADSQHFQQQRPSFQQDPNNYSDLSTPGSNETRGAPLGVPNRSPNATPFNDQHTYDGGMPPRSMYSNRSYGSQVPLAGAGMYSSNNSLHSMNSPPQSANFSDNPYNRYSTVPMSNAHTMGQINPNELADDDDWGMGPETPQAKRRSFVPGFGASRDGSRNGSPGSSIAGGVAGAGAGAAVAGALASRDGSGKYNAVSNVNGAASANGSGSHIGSHPELLAEKSEWLKRDHAKRKKRMWIAIAIIAVILLGAILGGVLGALLNKGGGHDGQHGSVSAGDVASDNKNDLNKDSDEIKKLMNNANLHKVFPGMDYTPLNAQSPGCDKVPPSQNNITRDVAVMSQLTNAIRLYGTDCNQTQMVIHAIQRLEVDMKIWLGVWLDDNNSTNKRQIAQTWDILDDYGCDYFKGIIIGNEVLYRKDLTATQLIDQITVFRQNITSHKCDLPVAMADLGDNWTADMAQKVDIVMSNVHPFFSGTPADQSAAWTWNFWQNNDVALTANDKNIKQVIAEVGWPSGGGTNCGGAATCAEGSVAGIDEMNRFMEDWVCPSLKNQTEYFWFSAFDEPWKIQYNEKGKEWEDKWGLMDVDRNLKSGVKIPDCDGAALPTFE